MLQDLSTGSSALRNPSKKPHPLIFLLYHRLFSDTSVIWVPNLWQLKSDQALSTEHRDHTGGVSSPTRAPPHVFAAPAPAPALQPWPWQARGLQDLLDTRTRRGSHSCTAQQHTCLLQIVLVPFQNCLVQSELLKMLCASCPSTPSWSLHSATRMHCSTGPFSLSFHDQEHTDHPGHNWGHSIPRERGDSGDGEQ